MKAYTLAVDAPIDNPLTYLAPEGDGLVFQLKRGSLVKVPLGKSGRQVSAVILREATPEEIESSKDFQLKEISEIDASGIEIPEVYVEWAEWLANYYLYPIGQVLANFVPPLKKGGRGTKKKSPIPKTEEKTPHLLNREQLEVVQQIPVSSEFQCHLLFGVTGSGKTEVYLELFEKALAQNKQCLFLLPEISLTPQLLRRFAERFGDKLAVIHSQLTEREKTNQWWEMVDGKKQILIGARSALFCPIPSLGLIVIDEEHESSYKQEEKLKYHARDAAIVLASKVACPVVLGSATPSLETWNNAKTGKFQFHKLTQRANQNPLPQVRVVDLRPLSTQDSTETDIPKWMSPELFSALSERIERKEQSALFLNRRGLSQSVVCDHCGSIRECPNCAISLSLHAKTHLLCHYCDYHEVKPKTCPHCQEGEWIPLGLGTEKIETDLIKLFPGVCVARADRDEISSREDMEQLVLDMESQKIDILVGTQMIAKGLDFPHLSLVSLVIADIGFNIPDFRSSERSFQLITQVSGRAGRHQTPGEVIVQAYNIDHPSIQHAIEADYQSFAEEELMHREALNYPPFGKLASIRLQGLDLYRVEEAAKQLAQIARKLQGQHESLKEILILGPTQAPLFKLRSKFRYHIMIKGKNPKLLGQFCKHLSKQIKLPPAVQISIDMDPIQLL